MKINSEWEIHHSTTESYERHNFLKPNSPSPSVFLRFMRHLSPRKKWMSNLEKELCSHYNELNVCSAFNQWEEDEKNIRLNNIEYFKLYSLEDPDLLS